MKASVLLLVLAVAATAQQPWTTTGGFSWTSGTVQSSLALATAGPKGELFLGNNLAGPPTKVLGAPNTFYTGVTKFNASGAPAFGVQINGAFDIYAMGLDGSGNVLIAGQTPATGLAVTPGAWGPSSSGPNSSFACKLSGLDGSPVFCTYLNSNRISVVAIAADAAGNVYLFADRNSAPIAPTPGALSLGDKDLLLMKLDPTGSNLLYAAEFGGRSVEGATALNVDGSGNAYVMGPTGSVDFPGAANGAIPGYAPWFVAKIDPGSKILYSSYLRPSYTPAAIGVDPAGSLYVAGVDAESTLSSLFAMKFTADGTGISYEMVLPPTGAFSLAGIAIDGTGNATIAGNTGFVAFMQHFGTATCRMAEQTNTTDSFFVRLNSTGELLQSTFAGAGNLPAQTVGITQGTNAAYLAGPTGVLTIGPDPTGASETSIGCYSNSASFVPEAVAPGEIVSLFGEGLGPSIGSAGLTATQLSGAQVTFDGVPAPLLYVEDRQINLIAPWGLAGKTSSRMCATYLGKSSCTSVIVAAAAPGVFTLDGKHAAAVNQDGTLNSPANPAHFGSIVSLYLTGLGAVTPQPADGANTQLPLPTLVEMPQLFGVEFIQGPGMLSGELPVPLQILYAGPAPLEVGGLFQINFVVSAFSTPVWVTYPQPGKLSGVPVTISIAP